MGPWMTYHLLESGNPVPLTKRRLSWEPRGLWAAEAATHPFHRGYFTATSSPQISSLTRTVHLGLSELPTGSFHQKMEKVLLDGVSGEPCRFYFSQNDPSIAGTSIRRTSLRSDALIIICFIMMGHDVFPDVIDGKDRWMV